MKISPILTRLHACDGARAWAKGKTLEDAWTTCPRSDWMLWLLTEIGHQDDKTYRLYACWCVRNTPLADGRKVWDLLTDKRSRNAVEVSERYAVGEATKEEMDAAWAAAWDADGDAAWAAAGAAARDAAWDAAWAAARDAAGDAAWAAAGDAARAFQADHLREVIPYSVVEAAVLAKWPAKEQPK